MKNPMHTLVRLALLLPAVAQTADIHAQGGGNRSIPWFVISKEAPTKSLDALTDWVADNVDPGLGMEMASHFNSGKIQYVELDSDFTSAVGAADADTIALNTMDYSLATCAVVLMHEYIHSFKARAAADAIIASGQGTGSNAQDPESSDPDCGYCNHASYHISGDGTTGSPSSLAMAAYLSCLAGGTGGPSEEWPDRQEICAFAIGTLHTIEALQEKCQEAVLAGRCSTTIALEAVTTDATAQLQGTFCFACPTPQ